MMFKTIEVGLVITVPGPGGALELPARQWSKAYRQGGEECVENRFVTD